MRLTLRTLLAYLDDVLEPSQIREIGAKIRESPVAAALVSRIRESIRRRRLGAPDLEGPGQGIDPNIVAAYLDNTLTPEQVVELEQVCLDADVQLAEVAACHQILTLDASETREVPQASLDRYYALGPVPFSDRLEIDIQPKPSRTQAAEQALESTADFVTRLPEKLKSDPWSQRVTPIAAAALIVLVAGALWMDRDLFRGLTKQGHPQQVAGLDGGQLNDAGVPPTRPPSPAHPTDDHPNDTVTPTPAPEIPPVNPLTALPRGLDPAPPPDAPEPSSATAPANVPEPPKTNVKPLPAPPVPTPATPDPPTAPPTIRVPMLYTSNEGVLLRYEPDDRHWYVHPRRSEIHAEEVFASPEPFEAAFEIDRGAFKLTLLGDSAVQILPATESKRQSVDLRRGRVVLQPGASGGPERLDFTLQIRNQRWLLHFSGPEAVCGVEVILREPVGLDKVWTVADGFHAALSVATGTVRVETGEPGSTATGVVLAGQRQPLTPWPWPTAVSSDAPTAWLDPQRRQKSDTLRSFAAKFEKEFEQAKEVDLTIFATAKSANPTLAELAVRCLALTETSDALVQALAQTNHAEARAAAAQGIRQWLGQEPGRGPIMLRELEGLYAAEEAQILYHLLWGFTADDARDKIASTQLVEWLRSSRIQIRELAIGQIALLTGRKLDYRPAGTPSQREPAVQRWIGHVQREGALVKPE